MDVKQEILANQRLAKEVQVALHKHEVDPFQIGETVYFLAQILGGIHTVVLPSKSISEILELIKDSIEYGMEMGIPEE